MPKLFIPVGIPGCGKSTWAETFMPSSLSIRSTDAIRATLGNVQDQSKNDEVFSRFHASIRNDLVAGRNVYADATNLRDFARDRLRSVVYAANGDRLALDRPADVEMHLLVFSNPDQAVARNLKRERVVPPEAMERMLDQYEQFRLDLPDERKFFKTVTEIRRVG
jgi:predicted kinase